MIEENNPEVNVDELMQKIREEVAKRHSYSQLKSTTSKPEIFNMMPSFNPILAEIEALLRNAEFRSEVRKKWPDNLNKFPFNLNKNIQKIPLKILNFFFKDQREVNFNLIRAIKDSVSLNRQLIEQIKSLRAQMDEHRITVNTRLQGIDERLGAVDIRLQAIDECLDTVFSRVPTIDDKLNKIDTYINSWMTGTEDRLDAVNSQAQLIDERLSAADTRLQGMDERHLRNDSYLKNDLVQQKRLLTMFLEEARRRLPEPFNQEQLQTFVNEEQHLLDGFYVAFEDQFRGSREEIIDRLKVYLPLLEEAKVGTPDSPIVDVGCGRGEWLELLHESGYTARGMDINRIMLEQCVARGLSVIEADVIAYLRSVADNSLGAVTGFHIIEHLPFAVLINLFDEAVRVLKPGGIVIFETPNPENVLVGSHTFYLDPTHRNPLPSAMIKFMAESRDLCRVVIMNLHPYLENQRLDGSPLAERFSNYFYGPQDYAVIGYKSWYLQK